MRYWEYALLTVHDPVKSNVFCQWWSSPVREKGATTDDGNHIAEEEWKEEGKLLPEEMKVYYLVDMFWGCLHAPPLQFAITQRLCWWSGLDGHVCTITPSLGYRQVSQGEIADSLENINCDVILQWENNRKQNSQIGTIWGGFINGFIIKSMGRV